MSPEPWHHDDNHDVNESMGGADAEGGEGQGQNMDDDDSSDVSPDILNDANNDDEDVNPRSRRRARKPKPKPQTKCKKCDETKRQWKNEVEELQEKYREDVGELKDEIKKLKEEIERLTRLRGNIQEPWNDRLDNFMNGFRGRDLDDDDDISYPGYQSIYNDSCMQGNMSIRTDATHPNLYLDTTVYGPRNIQQHFVRQRARDRDLGNPVFNNLEWLHRHIREIIFPFRVTRLNPLRFLENTPFPFERLPADLQSRILKLFIPHSELIHCLSRLDPANPPLDCEPGNVRFPSRFHIGDEICCVAKADKPCRYLDYLLVSKRWYYLASHLFYATNTFAFSSLGEFGRFCDGIGKARVQRLVNIELRWHGALTPKQANGVSLRKRPLAWFMHTSRLRTLAIHIDESGKSRMRRPYEMMHPSDYYKDFVSDEFAEEDLDIFGMEVRRTDSQPNYRKHRSMRTVQGMDFIYQLRGMKWVRFFDTNAEASRRQIHDWSFLKDVNFVATMKKSGSMALKSEIENLLPLPGLADFNPDDELSEVVSRFYSDAPVEDVSAGGSETSLSTVSDISGLSTVSDNSSSSSSSSSSSDSDDDDSGGSFRNPSRRPAGGRGPDIDRDVMEIDSETEMGDDDGASNMSNHNESHDGSLSATVTPQLSPSPVIVIPDDDENDGNRRRRSRYESYTSESGLFVRSGSCTANTDHGPDSGDDAGIDGLVELIDLTHDDSEDDMDVDSIENNQGEERDVEDAEKAIKIDDDGDDGDDDDGSNDGVKRETSSSRSAADSGSDESDGPPARSSLKRPRSRGNRG
ncbi:hypothetical protein NUW58_g6425 [Xylaria curta]|uniref:Uncharacterized protein n=1 Tax=Xylaria curta TaxID=42375 RepID=A0ACC1NUC8_9PEZI|nr:hypothetical protein NUW58_g6425 [Xylaria curta]